MSCRQIADKKESAEIPHLHRLYYYYAFIIPQNHSRNYTQIARKSLTCLYDLALAICEELFAVMVNVLVNLMRWLYPSFFTKIVPNITPCL